MSDATTALVVLGAVIALFVWNRLPVGIVALGAPVALYATSVLSLEQAMAGFGDPVVVFIASMFVVSEGIERTGITAWAGGRMVSLASGRTTRVLIGTMLLCAIATALISLSGAVAALIPMVVLVAMRSSSPPSRMLMPMVYAGSAGSLLVLIGSPVNIIVSEASDEAGAGAFGFFEFAWVGLPILVGTMLLAALLTRRLVPDRRSAVSTRDLSRHAETLAEYYNLADGFYRLRIRERSPWIGTPANELDLSEYPGIQLIGVQRGPGGPRLSADALEDDDVLVVSGSSAQVSLMAVEGVLAVSMTPIGSDDPGRLLNRQMGVVELVIPPRSPLVGETMFPGMVRASDLVILAIQHHGKDCGQVPVRLRAGDALLVYGAWSAVDSLTEVRDVVVVDSPDLIRRQVPLGPRAIEAAIILAAMVVLLTLDLVPPAIAGLLAAGAMVLGRVLSSEQAYRSVAWETVILVGGLIPLSTAIRVSGAGDDIAEHVIDLVGTGRPLLLMVVMFVLTTVLGLVLSNTATVLIVLPIALAVAAEGDLSVQPMLMLLAVACSGALLTPVQTPANLMVMAPGGYRFGDYWRLGLPILVLWFAVAMLVIPIVWPLTS